MSDYQDTEVERGESIAKKAAEAVQDLMFQHWPEILDSKGEDAKFAISFSVVIRDEGGGNRLDTTISFSRKYKDEREDYVSDPRQADLPME